MSVLLASSNNCLFMAFKYALFEFKYRLTQFSIDCDPFQDRSETSESKYHCTLIWDWSNYSKTLIYIPYKTLPDSEVLLPFSYLSQLPRKSLSSISIRVIHMCLIYFKENSGDQNCHHFNDSKMNNVPNKHYEHIMSHKFLFHVSQAIRSWICFPYF